ncbi:hypothetical protein [Bacillus cihuensis]|nr:hypothetical protein [Bacillus cihuensis]
MLGHTDVAAGRSALNLLFSESSTYCRFIEAKGEILATVVGD